MSEPQATILHVDDNEANRYVLTRILQDAGFTVIGAATGAAGLTAIAKYQPALVILDVKLPDMNGFEVCRQIKANPETASIPVLHLSASFVQSQDKAEGLDSGADAYLAQPIEPIELLATVRSLLRIRRAEESALTLVREWQTTFDAINDGVCLLDREGRFLRCNRAMLKLLDRTIQQALGCVHYELMRAVLGIGDGTCFRRAQETHQRQGLELQSNGRWFAKMVDPVLDEQGMFTGAVFILSDITDRKQVETLLQEQNKRLSQLMGSLQEKTEQAQQANRIKDEFLAVLSHELRSPLNPILGWAKLLQTGQLSEAKTAQALATIERNAKLQSELIEDLLDVSRILRGKLSLTVKATNLAATIQAALETVQLAAEAKSITVEATLNAEVGSVSGDATRLQQVVWNLLSNAVKFTPSGGWVKVQLAQIANHAQITVSDNGKGIAANFLPHVFDYFRQADGATTRKFGGLGLGLAIVRYLVELHGGTVEAASDGEGLGTTFTVRLPLMTIQSSLSPTPDAPVPSYDLTGIQALVVDDEVDSRDFIGFVLKQAGATVLTAASAGEALAVLSQSKLDVIVSDIGMPEMDGYMLMRQIRALPSHEGGETPAIALTAYAGDFNAQQAVQAGFQKHISKPVEPDALVRAITHLISTNIRQN